MNNVISHSMRTGLIIFGLLIFGREAIQFDSNLPQKHAVTSQPAANLQIELKELIQAIIDDDLWQVKQLLSKGININAKDKHGWTPLFHAVKHNNTAIAEFLLANGASTNIYSVDESGSNRITALHLATAQGNIGITRLLLANGSDVNAAGHSGNTPLHRAAQDSKNPEVVEELISRGGNVNAKNRKGQTPLMLSCSPAKISELLIKNGAAVDEQDSNGKTALYYSSYYRCYETAKVLLVNGANPKIKDQQGESPWDIAVKRKDKQLKRIFRSNGSK